MNKPIAIVLNGTSSAGKSSIARALLALLPFPVWHAQVDTFLRMLNFDVEMSEEELIACKESCIDMFHKSISSLATSTYPLVVDHVFVQHKWFETCKDLLADRKTYFVGVHCDLAILEERERERGDRNPGLARRQFDKVHLNKPYDFEVNTSASTPEECAAQIIKYVSAA
jgi:chloramphenicol 3-O phosphotransferase